MKVKSITYGRTFNDGNFESTRIDVAGDIEPTDTPENAFKDLVDTVNEMRELQLNSPAPQEPTRRPRR
jgi:hypothetical protein